MYEAQIAEEMRGVQRQIAALRRRVLVAPQELRDLLSKAHHAVDDVLCKAEALQEQQEDGQAFDANLEE